MTLTKIGASLGGSADTITVTQGSHGFGDADRGKAVKMTDSSGTPTYAFATANTVANADAIGIIIQVIDTTKFIIALSGRITVNSAVPDLAAGTVLFLPLAASLGVVMGGTDSGHLTATEPSAAGEVSKPMAVITIANSEMIMLQQRGEVISSGATDNHTVVSHSDTSATGPELDTLTDGSTTALHVHAARKLDDLATPDDNTDLNVSTSRHGLVPKITSTSNFLKGDGTWAAAGGGNLVLIDTATASTSSALLVYGLNSSTYQSYLVVASYIRPSADVVMQLRFGDGGSEGSPGIDSGSSDYVFHVGAVGSHSNSYGGSVANQNRIQLATAGVDNGANFSFGMEGWLHFNGSVQPLISGTTVYNQSDDTSLVYGGHFIGKRQAVMAVTAVELSPSSGTIISGRLTVWGLKHD